MVPQRYILLFLQGHNPGNDSDYSVGNAAVVHIIDLEQQFSWHHKTYRDFPAAKSYFREDLR